MLNFGISKLVVGGGGGGSGSASGKSGFYPRGLSLKEIRQLPLEYLSKCHAL